jgi:hypothetical protein
MRVMIASGVLVLGVALLAALSPSAAAASAVHSRTAIVVCPQTGSMPMCCPLPVGPVPPGAVRPDYVPCCPVPTSAGCCAPATATPCCATATATPCCTTTPCPAGLSIAASPNPVGEGSNATISGTLTGGTVASQTVDLHEQLAGQSAFADVANTQTDASGAYSFTRAVQTNAQWYVTAGTVQSATVAESVLAAIALHSSSVRPKAGAKITLSGTIAPSHAGEHVELQRLHRGQWLTIARPQLGAASGFTIAMKMRRKTTARFRVVLAADARNALSVSTVVTITPR